MSSKVAVLVMVVIFAGCTYPAKSYDRHLRIYGDDYALPKTRMSAKYEIDKYTREYSYVESRGNLFLFPVTKFLDFGDILDKSLQAEYVKSAFYEFERSDHGDSGKYLIRFSLMDYGEYYSRVTINMLVEIYNPDNVRVHQKLYTATKKPRHDLWFPEGKRFYYMSAIKAAVDQILTDLIYDINDRILTE